MKLCIVVLIINSFVQHISASKINVINEEDLVSMAVTAPRSQDVQSPSFDDLLPPEFNQDYIQQWSRLKDNNNDDDNDQDEGGGDSNDDSRPKIDSSVPLHCQRDEFVIHSLGDLNSIIECETIIGNVVISEFDYPIITFTNLVKIKGDLSIFKSPELVRIESPQLQSISGQFQLFELTSLALISVPSLKQVQALKWEILPILSNVQFNAEIKGIESITIADTSLTGFSGFVANELKVLDINNNRFLDTIDCNVEKVTQLLHISANSNEIKVQLPNLKQVEELSIHNVAVLNLGNLERVDKSMSLSSSLVHAVKLPKLKYIGGTLNLSKNSRLEVVEFPELDEIDGGLMVINNNLIEKVNFFPNLKIIGGALEITGKITELTFKNLKLVKGSAIVRSTSPQFDCQKWTKSEIGLVVRGGKIECTNANNEKVTSRTKEDGSEASEVRNDDEQSSRKGEDNEQKEKPGQVEDKSGGNNGSKNRTSSSKNDKFTKSSSSSYNWGSFYSVYVVFIVVIFSIETSI
nr:Sps2 [Candida metapsilosis]